jgi:hypothetical protein
VYVPAVARDREKQDTFGLQKIKDLARFTHDFQPKSKARVLTATSNLALTAVVPSVMVPVSLFQK